MRRVVLLALVLSACVTPVRTPHMRQAISKCVMVSMKLCVNSRMVCEFKRQHACMTLYGYKWEAGQYWLTPDGRLSKEIE